jgi:hypothetical protein
MLNFLKNLANEIVTKPEKTSRAVVAVILIVGMCALTFDFGPRVMPQYFASDVGGIDTLSADDLRNPERTPEKLSQDVQTCFSNRKSDKAAKFIESFEKSFNGILPGAGNMLKEHSGMVTSRSEKLTLEVMKRYANLKFCISGEAYKTIHMGGYSTILNDLDPYIQTRAWEKEGNQDNNGLYMSAVTAEYDFAEKDLAKTRAYIEKTIANAIQSAKESDQQTTATIASLSTETVNKLNDRSNSLLEIANEIGNIQTGVLGNHSLLLDKIAQLEAYQNAGPTTAKKPYFLGEDTPPDQIKWRNSFKEDDGDGGETEYEYMEIPDDVEPNTGWLVDLDLPEATGLKKVHDQTATEISGSASGNRYAYGILNLVDAFTKADFLALGFKKAVLLYTAAQNNFDPYAPRAGFLSGAQDLPEPPAATVESQLCKSIDTPGANCFGVSI